MTDTPHPLVFALQKLSRGSRVAGRREGLFELASAALA